jgi:hypothetical protein
LFVCSHFIPPVDIITKIAPSNSDSDIQESDNESDKPEIHPEYPDIPAVHKNIQYQVRSRVLQEHCGHHDRTGEGGVGLQLDNKRNRVVCA